MTQATQQLRLAELIGALSHALDLTEGQPRGHCIRCCWIGVNLGKAIGYSREELSDLYYTLLLKDLGCSSNAARICQLYLAEDQTFKRDFKRIDGSLPQALRFVLGHTGLTAPMAERFRAITNILRNGGEISRELIEARCHRGAEIAGQMRFSPAVCSAIENLDEHWDGHGKPEGRQRRDIPQAAQIALLAQVADVFLMGDGRAAAIREIHSRATTWFDPSLVEVFTALADDDAFWATLAAPDLTTQVLALEPEDILRRVDEDYLDDIALAFAKVIDAKSPFTSGHSERVAVYTDLIAEGLGETPAARRMLRRAALLHDVGKLGISNTILDKPGKLTDAEFAEIKKHPSHSGDILSGIAVFADIAAIGRDHHEKLDGSGYPHGLKAEQISHHTRIVTTADIFDALTADRPYRKAMPTSQAFAIMEKDVGTALDADCFGSTTQGHVTGTGRMILRLAELDIDPAHLANYNALLAEEIEASVRLEPGVLFLKAVSLQDAPTQVRVFECYADEAAYQHHLTTPHFLKYKTETAAMVKSLRLMQADPIALHAKDGIFHP